MIQNPFLESPSPEPLHELTDERFTQFTDLPPGGEEEVMALISSEARNNVRRAARRGVTVERDNDALDDVHLIHEETMAGFEQPPKSARFFDAIPASCGRARTSTSGSRGWRVSSRRLCW